MDTIAVVGSGERALALLAALAESRFEVVSVSTSPDKVRVALRRKLPAAARASWLADARFDCDLGVLRDCSIVLDTGYVDDASARGDAAECGDEPYARLLATLELHMSSGAVLVAATQRPDALASALVRPEQFLGLASRGGRAIPLPCESTAPGALFAVERLADELAGCVTVNGLLAESTARVA